MRRWNIKDYGSSLTRYDDPFLRKATNSELIMALRGTFIRCRASYILLCTSWVDSKDDIYHEASSPQCVFAAVNLGMERGWLTANDLTDRMPEIRYYLTDVGRAALESMPNLPAPFAILHVRNTDIRKLLKAPS